MTKLEVTKEYINTANKILIKIEEEQERKKKQKKKKRRKTI